MYCGSHGFRGDSGYEEAGCIVEVTGSAVTAVASMSHGPCATTRISRRTGGGPRPTR